MTRDEALQYLNGLRYVHARDQWPRRTSAPHMWIVLHSIEAAENPYTAENCANYFANPGNRVASTQFVCDNDSTIRCMGWDTRGASAVGANDEGWHIEQAGFAGQSASDWRDAYSLSMIKGQVAKLVAALSLRDGIPLRFVNAAGLRRGEKGVTTHAECYRAFGGDVRTDPGAQYPMDILLAEATAIVGGANPGDDEVTPADIEAVAQRVVALLGANAAGDNPHSIAAVQQQVEGGLNKVIDAVNAAGENTVARLGPNSKGDNAYSIAAVLEKI